MARSTEIWGLFQMAGAIVTISLCLRKSAKASAGLDSRASPSATPSPLDFSDNAPNAYRCETVLVHLDGEGDALRVIPQVFVRYSTAR